MPSGVESSGAWDWRLPEWISSPEVSCSSCHDPAFAFADPRQFSEGLTGRATPRNAPSIANLAYASYLTWSNLVLLELESQAMVPLFGDNPLEMGAIADLSFLIGRLGQDAEYSRMFADAFPQIPRNDRINWKTVIDALACFQRSLISLTSPYDEFLAGNTQALDESQRRGLALFESERLACSACHRGPLLSAAFIPGQATSDASVQESFRNTGLYYLPDEVGGYPSPNVGILEFTQDPKDGGKFRIPSLPNVEKTAPYMHDGSIGSLD